MGKKKEINILVGANIKREREKAGFTQEQFSELIGIETKSLSAVERGIVGVSLSTLQQICRVLSISSNVLLFEHTHENDVGSLVEYLAALPPEQYRIAEAVLHKVCEAFTLQNNSFSV